MRIQILIQGFNGLSYQDFREMGPQGIFMVLTAIKIQLNPSWTATLGTEENGHCREVETRVNVQADRQKSGHCRKAEVSEGLTVFKIT